MAAAAMKNNTNISARLSVRCACLATSMNRITVTQRAAAPKAPEGPVDPDLAALPEPVRARLKAQLDTMMKLDAPALKEQLAALEARLGSMPPQARPTVEYLMKKGRERLQNLEAK